MGNESRLDVILQEPQQRAFDCEIREVEGESRTLRFVASTEDVASDGDIIRVSAWDTERFEKNPVFLWAHDAGGMLGGAPTPPIGRVTKITKVTDTAKPRLEADVEFAGQDENHELAETVFRLFKRGFLNAVSVGFRVRGFEKPDDDDRNTLGLGPFGVVITAAELLELSAVPVPADAGALKIGDDDRAEVKADYARVRSFFPDKVRAEIDKEFWPPFDEHGTARTLTYVVPSLRDWPLVCTPVTWTGSDFNWAPGVTRTDLRQIINAELTDRLDEMLATMEEVRDRLDALGSPETPATGSEPEAPSPYTEAAIKALRERNERSRS